MDHSTTGRVLVMVQEGESSQVNQLIAHRCCWSKKSEREGSESEA
jgi:hypothetical protein